MKNKIASLLFLLPALFLTSCGENSSSSDSSSSSSQSSEKTPEEIAKALSSLRKNSHQVEISSIVKVTHPDNNQAIDIQVATDETIKHSYADGERGYQVSGKRVNSDLEKETGEPIEATATTHPIAEQTIFENPEDGLAYSEILNVDNTVSRSLPSIQNSETGIYDPIVFASEFKNPWDYIEEKDLSYEKDGNIHLDLDKAEFLKECYGLSSVNKADDCVVNLDSNGNIATLRFAIEDLVASNFVRQSTLDVSYSRHGEKVVEHVTPLTNQNPELETALSALKTAKNFTYEKTIENLSDGTKMLTTGYYDKENGLAFFHQGEEDKPYTAGDNYDYVASYQKDGDYAGKWLGYEYVFSSSWNWSTIMVSSTAPYVIDSWDELIPQFDSVSAAVFTNTDGVYTADKRLDASIASYFDNPFLGANSEALLTDGTGLSLTLKDGKIDTVSTGFDFMGTDYKVTFTLKDIDSTTLPSYFLETWNG